MEFYRTSHPITTHAPDPSMHDEILNMRNEEHAGAARKFGDGAILMVEHHMGQLESRFMQEIQKRYRARYERVTHHDNCEQNDLAAMRSFLEGERMRRGPGLLRMLKKRYRAWQSSMQHNQTSHKDELDGS